MSTRQMLYALVRVNNMLNGAWPPSDDELQKVREQVRAAVGAGLDTSQRMAEAAERRASGTRVGRRPTARYEVDITNYAPAVCIGAGAAVERVNEVLAEHKLKKRLTVNNLTTTISTKGGWWTNIDTTNGTVTIGVRRLSDAEKSA